ncbi:MAG: hypothetical protein B6I19_01105 [Bacteroidetes bacterium 4572_114]|nr:MAG: hypothetical protein B6I19_01105 [Bacteroidetes bacterium 4572_114]
MMENWKVGKGGNGKMESWKVGIGENGIGKVSAIIKYCFQNISQLQTYTHWPLGFLLLEK